MAEPDVAALVKQTEHLNLLVGSLRDEMRVLSAVVLRLDDSMAALARECAPTWHGWMTGDANWKAPTNRTWRR